MVQESVLVVVNRDNVVSESWLFVGSHDAISKRAESKFISLTKDEFPNEDEQNDLLDNGYVELSDGSSVVITWPEVVAV